MSGLAMIDFDGTLCSTHAAVRHVIGLTFTSLGREPAPLDEIESAIASGVVVSEVFNRLLGRPAGDAEGAAFAWRYREIYNGGEGLARTQIFPGVREGLRALAASGWRCFLVSNKGIAALRQALAHFDIEQHFERLIGDTPGQRRKPDPGLFRDAILPHFAACGPARSFVLGDTATDLAFARNIGARAYWAEYGFGDRAACLTLAPDARLARFDEISAVAGHAA